ncbi:MAG: 2-C-methyl-D-erythritol 4-phosphate cytidylyltransferase, partial [Pseudomonadota bacterium]
MTKAHAIIVAGGQGRRAGGEQPKQYQVLAGRPVLAWSASTFQAHPAIDQLVIVVPAGNERDVSALAGDGARIVAGGATRTASVMAGLSALEGEAQDIVLIHDAARPGLASDTIDQLLDALGGADAAAPALPVADALKRDRDGRLETVDRAALYRVQTP